MNSVVYWLISAVVDSNLLFRGRCHHYIIRFVGFSVILPTVLNALLIGAKDELDSLVSLYAAVDTFVSYCAAITVPQLQRYVLLRIL